jgi:gliding motility-associated transport system permease protein
MNGFLAVFKRELKSYFGTPLAYVFLAMFLMVSSGWMYMSDFFLQGEASMRIFFGKLPWLFAFFAPLISMGMWAEERRTGSIEMLLTLPLTVRQAVLGKFIAGWAFMVIALVLTLPILFTVQSLGDPEMGPIFTGYFGAVLLSGACLAVSSFFSVITKSQVISCVLAVIACVSFILVGNPSFQPFLPEAVSNLFTTLSFATQFDVMQRGIIEVENIVFMTVITAGFVFASIVMLDDRKAA